MNIYAHTVNRFKKLDSVDGLTTDLVKDPPIEAAFNRIPNELVSNLSLILVPIMLVSHTYNHIIIEETNITENEIISKIGRFRYSRFTYIFTNLSYRIFMNT